MTFYCGVVLLNSFLQIQNLSLSFKTAKELHARMELLSSGPKWKSRHIMTQHPTKRLILLWPNWMYPIPSHKPSGKRPHQFHPLSTLPDCRESGAHFYRVVIWKLCLGNAGEHLKKHISCTLIHTHVDSTSCWPNPTWYNLILRQDTDICHGGTLSSLPTLNQPCKLGYVVPNKGL